MSALWTPPSARRSRGRDRWPTPDVLPLATGGRLTFLDTIVGPDIVGRMYRGPKGLVVIVSLDRHAPPLGTLLHASLSLPQGYPGWDLIVTVKRAVFGDDVDAMLPIPREEAYVHHPPGVPRGEPEVFHVVEMPHAWPREDGAGW